MSKDHGHRFAVYSPTGVHIGLWTDGKIASEVQSETPGNTVEELVMLDLAQAMVAKAREDALREAAEKLGNLHAGFTYRPRDMRRHVLQMIDRTAEGDT